MHYIGQFGLGVGLNTVVFIVFLLKMDVAPINATLIVCHTWDIDDPVTRIEIALGLNLRAAIWLFFFNYGLGRAWKMQKTRHCWRCCKPLLKRDRIHLCIFSDSLILSLSSFENHKKCHTLKWSKKMHFHHYNNLGHFQTLVCIFWIWSSVKLWKNQFFPDKKRRRLRVKRSYSCSTKDEVTCLTSLIISV